MANEIIRSYLKKTCFYQWRLAELLGISERQMSTMLRKELPEEIQTGMVNLVRSVLREEEYDTEFFWKWKRKQLEISEAKRIEAIKGIHSDYQRKRAIDKALDEAEQRRIAGGWDLSI